jgi:hypothetical protein
MNEQPIPERVYRVIGECLNRTVDKGFSPGEAEQAAERVQELLMKYNLSLVDIQGRTKDGKKRSYTKHFYDLLGKQKAHDSDWVCVLVNIIAMHNFCRAIHVPPIGKMVILGEAHNIEVAEYLIDYLIPRIERVCSSAWAVYYGYEKRNTFRRGFLQGCVAGIGHKLEDQKNKMAAENNTALGLIKINNDELDEYTKQIFGEDLVKPKSGRLRESEESQILGYRAGKTIPINKGLDNKETSSGYLD